MIEFEINITLNRPSDADRAEEMIKSLAIQAPVFILDFGESCQISFTSDYGYYEINTLVEREFDGYELVKYPGNGKKEIRLQIHRYQSPVSTDGWGRRIEDPVDETLYLIKKAKPKPVTYNPKVRVLFEDTAKEYYINIVPGLRKSDNQEGFLIIDSFENIHGLDNKDKQLIQKLYPNVGDAFRGGISLLIDFAKDKFSDYLNAKKKSKRKKK
jgi:hypothetical protein